MAHTLSGIQMLPSEVIDQIAAGEVVERPAHLVKELVENSLDAGATVIEIEFDQGGRRVRVTDDGSGISEKDLALAFARHATSKISSHDDLWNLDSFGFRGEALASIASVSRMTLISRVRDGDSGAGPAHRIQSEFGRVSSVEPVGGNPGTTVLVEELFENVPARLKFMKSEGAEVAQIKTTLRALALANEHVEFRLRTKGKLECVWSKAETFFARARQVVVAENLYESELEYEGFRAQVVFAGPHEVAGTSRGILLFVQKRWVQDRSLQAAVIEAFRGLLMHGEFPIAVIRLEAPHGEVDVNIHPTKSQVKFRDNQPAFRAVNRALREGLERAPWLARESANTLARDESKLSVADLTRPYVALPVEDKETETGLATAPIHTVGRFESPEFQTVVFKKKLDVETQTHPSTSAATQSGPWSRLQVLGQAHLTYILAQDEAKLILIDQHAAHERVAFERLMRAWTGGDVKVQSLLIPLTLDLEPGGAESLLSVQSELEKLGIAIDQLGPQSVAVRTKPVILSDAALLKALLSFARELTDRGGSFAIERKISDLCASMACHSVVRAGQALSLEQMRNLLAQMDEFPLSSFCPHGRPVSVEYPFTLLERDFGRTV